MAKYLDYDGVLYFWQKIRAKFSAKGHTHPAPTPTTGTAWISATLDASKVTTGTASSVTPVTASVASHVFKITPGSAVSVPNLTVTSGSITPTTDTFVKSIPSIPASTDDTV